MSAREPENPNRMPPAASERDRILELFERHRKTPGAPFEESHFLDYLLAAPKKRRAVYDSFPGLWRLNAFLDAVQSEFSICFSLKDREANHSLDGFVRRVAELGRNRRSSLASLRSRQMQPFGWSPVVFFNILGLSACAIAFRLSPFLAGLLAVAIVLANAAAVRAFVRERAYCRRLMAKIKGSAEERA